MAKAREYGSKEVGEYLKRKRLALGLTQEEVATAAGTTKATVQRVEAGKRNAGRDLWLSLARAVQADPAEALAVWAKRDEQPPAQVVYDESGKPWRVTKRLGDPETPFRLTAEAARVLSALGFLETGEEEGEQEHSSQQQGQGPTAGTGEGDGAEVTGAAPTANAGHKQ